MIYLIVKYQSEDCSIFNVTMKRSPRRSNGISHVTIFIDCLLNLRKSHQAIEHLKNAKFRGNSQKYVTVFMKWSTKPQEKGSSTKPHEEAQRLLSTEEIIFRYFSFSICHLRLLGGDRSYPCCGGTSSPSP